MNYTNHILKTLKLFIRKIRLGRNLVLNSPIYKYGIAQPAYIRCGDNGKMTLGCIYTETNVHLGSWGGIITIGEGCSFNRNVIIISRKQISIGNKTIIGPNVCIYDHDHEFGPNGVISDKYKDGTVSIGNNVWIGAGSIILRGSIIGDNCVIGAGCVITGEIPANSLVISENRNLQIERLDKRHDKS